jgi:hypothetical protein
MDILYGVLNAEEKIESTKGLTIVRGGKQLNKTIEASRIGREIKALQHVRDRVRKLYQERGVTPHDIDFNKLNSAISRLGKLKDELEADASEEQQPNKKATKN